MKKGFILAIVLTLTCSFAKAQKITDTKFKVSGQVSSVMIKGEMMDAPEELFFALKLKNGVPNLRLYFKFDDGFEDTLKEWSVSDASIVKSKEDYFIMDIPKDAIYASCNKMSDGTWAVVIW